MTKAGRIGATLTRRSATLLTGPIFRTAVRDSFVKLDPRQQIRNPVMFVVLAGQRSHDRPCNRCAHRCDQPGRPAVVRRRDRAWLWLTVLFANFAEAVAEGRGKAQADALRATRRDVQARRLIGRSRDRGSIACRRARCGATTWSSSKPKRRYPPTARSSTASPRSMRARSPVSRLPWCASRGATFPPSPVARVCCPTGWSYA